MRPRSPCPLAPDAVLAHDGVPSRACPFPSGDHTPHMFNYEWSEHLIKSHSRGLQCLERLYQHLWQLYICKQPATPCPVPGITLPALSSSEPKFDSPAAASQATRQLLIALGFLDTLHW